MDKEIKNKKDNLEDIKEKQNSLIELSHKIKSENSAYYFHGGSGPS